MQEDAGGCRSMQEDAAGMQGDAVGMQGGCSGDAGGCRGVQRGAEVCSGYKLAAAKADYSRQMQTIADQGKPWQTKPSVISVVLPATDAFYQSKTVTSLTLTFIMTRTVKRCK